MSDYFLAPALATLRDEVNTKFPKRDKSSDGWIGDASHAARPSEHNPDWSATGRSHGIVRALDLDSNGKPGERTELVSSVLEAVIGDARTWYVIWDRVIWSRTYAFAPRAYLGENPHDHHVHVSLNGANGLSGDPGNFDTSPWFDTPPPPPGSVGPQLDLAIAAVRKAIRHHRRLGHTAIVKALVADLAELRETRRRFPR